MEANKLAVVTELDATNFEDVVQGSGIVVFAVTDPAASATKPFVKSLVNVARRYRQFVFANIDGVKFNKYVAQFSVSETALPTVFALNYTADNYFVTDEYAQANTEAKVNNFIEGILSGTVPARATSAWYSPMRYYKMFEKWLSTFSETQLMVGVMLAMLSFVGLTIAGCYYATQDLGGDDTPGKDSAAPPAEAKKKQ